LLSRVSGIGDGLARSIVSYREAHGPFRTRSALKKVQRLGPKAFELSAGFLRIRNGDDPLDASGVHPEAYSVRAAHSRGNQEPTGGADRKYTDTTPAREPEAFTDVVFGVPTVTDILSELEKPGRDPPPVFKTASFSRGSGKARGSEARHGSRRCRRRRRMRRRSSRCGGPPGRAGALLPATLAEVMTPNPDTMPPGKIAIEALRLMEDGHHRHLPIVDDGKVVGIVSRFDFSGIELDRLDEEIGLWERI
jgi:competence ComEA-like helix-hairpin-helix protein